MSWAHIRLAAYSQGSRPTGMERRPRPRTNSQVNRPVSLQWTYSYSYSKRVQLTRNLPPRTSNVQGLEWRDHLPHFGLEPNPTEFQSITDSIYSIADAITSIKDQGGQRGGLWRTAKCIRELRRGLTSWPLQMVRSTFYVRGLGALTSMYVGSEQCSYFAYFEQSTDPCYIIHPFLRAPIHNQP